VSQAFSPRDQESWAVRGAEGLELPAPGQELDPDFILERARRSIEDPALSLGDLLQLISDASTVFLLTADQERNAHEAVLSLSSSRNQAEEAAASRGKLQVVAERLDHAISQLLGDPLEGAREREDQVQRRCLYQEASRRVPEASQALLEAEAAFLAAKDRAREAYSLANRANARLPRGKPAIPIPEALKGEVMVSVEMIEAWSQQDSRGVVTRYPEGEVDVSQSRTKNPTTAVRNNEFVQWRVFDKIRFRKLGEKKIETRWVHRPDLDLRTSRHVAREAEGSDRPPIPAEAMLRDINQAQQGNARMAEARELVMREARERANGSASSPRGTQTYIERGVRTTKPM